jgi:hypothetical protein
MLPGARFSVREFFDSRIVEDRLAQDALSESGFDFRMPDEKSRAYALLIRNKRA